MREVTQGSVMYEEILFALGNEPGAQLVSEGAHFDVDERNARALLGWLRLEDPRRYVLELVHVASLLGTSFMTVHVDTTLCSVSFDGESFSAEELDDLYSAAFRVRHSARDEAMRHLALALGAAQALHPSHIEIDARGRDESHRLVIRHGVEDQLVTRDGEVVRGMNVWIRQRPRLEHARVFWARLWDRQVEVSLLREACRFAPFPLWVNGERVSRGIHLEHECDVKVAWEDARSRGELCVVFAQQESEIIWVHHGVVVKVQRVHHAGFCVYAVIDVPGVRLDLSFGGVVEDEAWAYAQQVLEDQTHRALRRALEPLIVDDVLCIEDDFLKAQVGAHPYFWKLSTSLLRQIVCDSLTRPRGALIPGHMRAWFELCEGVKMWPAADHVQSAARWERGEVSMRELGVGLWREGALSVSRERFPVRCFEDDRKVLWVRTYDLQRPQEVLEAYLGVEAVDVTAQLKRAYLCALNRKAWRATEPVAELSRKRHVVVLRGGVKGALGSVELGLRDGGRTSAECVMAPGGRVIRVVQLEGVAPVHATWIWRGELQPSELYDDVERDRVAWRFVLRSLELLPQALQQWCEKSGEQPTSGVQRAMLESLVWWSEGRMGEMFLRSLGFWTSDWAPRYVMWRGARTHGLFGLGAYHAQANRTDEQLARLCRKLGAMGDVALCEDVSGELVSVRAMLCSALEHGRLAVVALEGLDEARRHWRYAAVDRVVVVLDAWTQRLVSALCGPGRMVAFEAELARRAGAQRFMAMRQVERVLDRSVVARATIEEEGCIGEIGLLARQSDVPGRCDVRVLYMGRLLAQIVVPVPCGRMIAVVDAAYVQPAAGWRGLREDEHHARLIAQLRASAQQIYHVYVEQMMQAHITVDGDVMWFCMMCRLAGLAAREQLSAGLGRLIDSVPMWRMASGERMSLSAVRARQEHVSDLVYSHARMSQEVVSWEGVARECVVMVPGDVAHVESWLLECMEGHHRIVSVADVQQGARDVLRAREKFLERPQREIALDGEVLHEHTLRFTSADVQGVIGLRLDDSPLLCRGVVDVVWMSEGRRVMRGRVAVPIGCFDAVVQDDRLIDWAESDAVRVDILRSNDEVLREHVRALWEAYMQRAIVNPAGLREEARQMVMMYAWQLRDRGLDAMQRVIARMPIYEDELGEFYSAAQLGEREVVRCVEGERQGLRAGVIVVSGEAQRRAMRGAIFPVKVEDAPEVEQEERPPHRAVRGVEQDDRQDEEVRQRDDLASLVARTIEEVCGEMVYLRDPNRTRNVEVVKIEAGGAGVWVREDGVWLSREDDAVRTWMARADVVNLCVVTSAVYSALNAYEEEVTDGHEEEFLIRLAAWSLEQVMN